MLGHLSVKDCRVYECAYPLVFPACLRVKLSGGCTQSFSCSWGGRPGEHLVLIKVIMRAETGIWHSAGWGITGVDSISIRPTTNLQSARAYYYFFKDLYLVMNHVVTF